MIRNTLASFLLITIISQIQGFTNPPSIHRHHHDDITTTTTTTTTTQFAKKGTIEIPPNEFSRPLRTEAILGPRRKEYTTSISANEDELQDLAKRFSLSSISRLHADLTLRRDRNHASPGMGVECVQVKGDISATCTQTCVRTNEDFEVDLEFSMLSIVRSCGVSNGNGQEDEGSLGGMSAADLEQALGSGGGGGGSRKKGKKKKRKEVNMRDSKRSLDDMRMKEIEDLLQDFDLDEDVVEDENIFGMDGMLDVGELVAQTFRLKLDPYPKKPGSEPVSYSITG